MAIEFRLDTATSETLAFICQSYGQSEWQIVHIHSRAIGSENTHYEVLFSQVFDDEKVGELTAARAEIARLTAALAESEAARKVADAGWSECIDVCDELKRANAMLQQDSGIPF